MRRVARLLVWAAMLALAACSKQSPAPSSADDGGVGAISVRVPAAIRIARSLETLTVTFDPAAFAPTTVAVDPGMIVGIETDTFVYPMGGRRAPQAGQTSIVAGPMVAIDAQLWKPRDGIPAPGKRYAVDIDVRVFETDVPVESEWTPRAGRYKVLWSRTLHQTEE